MIVHTQVENTEQPDDKTCLCIGFGKKSNVCALGTGKGFCFYLDDDIVYSEV